MDKIDITNPCVMRMSPDAAKDYLDFRELKNKKEVIKKLRADLEKEILDCVDLIFKLNSQVIDISKPKDINQLDPIDKKGNGCC